MDLTKVQGIIISAEKELLSIADNAKRTSQMLCELLDLCGDAALVVPANGHYNRYGEQSFVIVPGRELLKNDKALRNFVLCTLLLANTYNQEAALFIGGGVGRFLWLSDFNIDMPSFENVSEEMVFTEVTEEEASTALLQGHTEVNGRYFILGTNGNKP